MCSHFIFPPFFSLYTYYYYYYLLLVYEFEFEFELVLVLLYMCICRCPNNISMCFIVIGVSNNFPASRIIVQQRYNSNWKIAFEHYPQWRFPTYSYCGQNYTQITNKSKHKTTPTTIIIIIEK